MKPIGSNIRSSASVARMVELDVWLARDTNTTRAASPPLATRILLSPVPAIIALTASHNDGLPAGFRNSHQRTPLITIVATFISTAAMTSASDADLMTFQAVVHSMVLANVTRRTIITVVIIHRIALDVGGFIGL